MKLVIIYKDIFLFNYFILIFITQNAHMIVIEAIMALYIKDILIADQVTEVVSRYYAIQNEDLPLTIEETALFWVNKSAQRLKQQAKDELARFENESLSYVPSIHEAQELAELGSGASLLALISLYCPDYINWTEICLKEQLTLEECMANLEMLQYFCAKYLPYDICFLDIEDFLRLQNAMKINLLAFIADLLYLFEIKPANCVRRVTSSEDHQLHQSIDHPATISDEEMRLSDNQALLAKGTPAQLRSSRSQLLSASQMKARSLRHTSWTELESDEMSGDHHDPRLYQQQKLAKYFQPHQHLREELHKPLLRSESTSSTLNKHPQRNLRKQSSGDNGIHDLAQELSSLRMDSNLEAGFYLSHDVNSNHVHNNNGPNDSIHPSASPISFAKLSKTKDNSINAVNSTTITTTTPSQSSTLSRPAINVAYSSNEYFDKSASEMDVHGKSSMPTETELGGQIMEIRLKLGEKRRQIEMGRRQQEDQWKTQRQGIGKEAFLKALKKEKLNCSGSSSLLYSGGQKTINSSHDHLTHHLDVSEMKENLENHSRNADTIKRSMDLLGNSCAVDFENGNTQILDSQRKLRNASFGQTSNGSNQFFLHADDISAEEAFLHNNTQQNSSLHLNKRFSDYINSTQAPQQQQLSQVDSEQKYLNYDHSTSNPLNGQSTNSPDEQISSQNNKDKGFFILFEDEKKPRSMPPSLRSRIKGKTEPTESPSVDNVTQMISTETPSAVKSIGFVIGPEPDPMSELEKAKKKEMIVIQSLKRRAEQESQRIIKEDELSKQREMER